MAGIVENQAATMSAIFKAKADIKDEADGFQRKRLNIVQLLFPSNLHICHSQTWSQLVKVFVTVLAMMKNLHRVLKLIVTV
jgi:hypothetical protein